MTAICAEKGLIPIVKIRVCSDVTSEEVLALCDTGSANSFISDSVANKLGVSGTPVSMALSGIHSEAE